MSLYGIDISQFQAVGVQGKDFTIIRATYGTGYVDPHCDQHYQVAKEQGKLRGVYHYAYPQYNTALDEANWFVDNIQGYIGDALLVLDWEEGNKADVAWAKAFLDQVYARTGVRALIYMSASVTGIADWTPVSNDYALWCAGYPNSFNVPSPPTPADDGIDMLYDTHAWEFATIWQYTSSAGTLDRDIAYMNAEGWMRFATPVHVQPSPVDTQPPANPTPDPTPEPDAPSGPTSDSTGPTGPTGVEGPTGVQTGSTGVVVGPSGPTESVDVITKIIEAIVKFFKAIFGKK